MDIETKVEHNLIRIKWNKMKIETKMEHNQIWIKWNKMNIETKVEHNINLIWIKWNTHTDSGWFTVYILALGRWRSSAASALSDQSISSGKPVPRFVASVV